MKKNNRFIVKENARLGLGAIQIIVDTETGVNYLLGSLGDGCGITPLLDKNGNIQIDDVEKGFINNNS